MKLITMFLFLTWAVGILEMNRHLISSKYLRFSSNYFWILPSPHSSNLGPVSSFKFFLILGFISLQNINGILHLLKIKFLCFMELNR